MDSYRLIRLPDPGGDVFVRRGECFQDVHVSDLVKPSSLSLPFLSVPPLHPHPPLSLSVSRFLCTAEETWTVPSFCEYHTHIRLCNLASIWANTHTHRLPCCTCWIIFGVRNSGLLGETDSLNASQRHEKRLIYAQMKASGSSQTVCVIVHSNPKPFRTFQTRFIVANAGVQKRTKDSWKNTKSNQNQNYGRLQTCNSSDFFLYHSQELPTLICCCSKFKDI